MGGGTGVGGSGLVLGKDLRGWLHIMMVLGSNSLNPALLLINEPSDLRQASLFLSFLYLKILEIEYVS